MNRALLTAGLVSLLTSPAEAQRKSHPKTPPPIVVTAPSSHVGTYTAGALAGSSVGDLYARYTGVTGVVPQKVDVDFCKQLQTMWNVKVKRSGGNAVVKSTGQELVTDYCTKRNDQTVHHITIDEFIARADRVVKDLQGSFDWTAYGEKKHLSARALAATRKHASALTGRDITAYALTELMPSPNGSFNVKVLDFLIRNAGAEYIDDIPAMYDPKTSFGPFQFTEYALFDNGHEQRGASVPNLAVKNTAFRIPGSVARLRGTQHIAAAFLFSLDNLANLAKAASDKELDVLLNLPAGKKGDLVEYLGTAHHGPAPAITMARRWLANGANADYIVSTNGRFHPYAFKTQENFRALHAQKTFGRALYEPAPARR